MDKTFEQKLADLSEESQKYYQNIKIITCKGDKCRLHANDFCGIHCESCYMDFDKINPIEVDKDIMESYQYREVTTFDCHGSKCRIRGDHGTGFHCVACYGEWGITEKEEDIETEDIVE